MPYNVISYKALTEINNDLIIDVVSWGLSKKLTPYQAPKISNVNYFLEDQLSLSDIKKMIQKKKYSLLYICGRREKIYLKAAIFAKKKGIKIIGQTDEQYYGNFKQLIVKVLSYFLYRKYFDFIFVPGYFQYEYMRYIGFKKEQILIGAYTANTKLFNNYYYSSKNRTLPNELNLLYLGRLEKVKGLDFLIESLKRINSSNIKLNIIGNGSMLDKIKNHDFINHTQFMSQNEILNKLDDITFFILPSSYEPWGVVLHEMAAAGIPLICSNEVGARSAFLFNNYNGFLYRHNDYKSFNKAIMKALHITNEKWITYRKRSYELSKSVTPEIWAETINSFII